MTTKLCPACNLPNRTPGMAVPASDGLVVHIVFLICHRCTDRLGRLPMAVRTKAMDRAAGKALANPEGYRVQGYPSPGAADLAAAMLGHAGFMDKVMEGFS